MYIFVMNVWSFCTSIIEAELYDDEKAGYTLNELNDIPSPKEIKKY